MRKKQNLAKQFARQSSKIGWPTRKSLLRQQKKHLISEFNQLHMSMGRGHHLARSFKGHDKHWRG